MSEGKKITTEMLKPDGVSLDRSAMDHFVMDAVNDLDSNLVDLAKEIGPAWDKKTAEDFCDKYFAGGEKFKVDDIIRAAQDKGYTVELDRDCMMYLNHGILLITVDVSGMNLSDRSQAKEILDLFTYYLSVNTGDSINVPMETLDDGYFAAMFAVVLEGAYEWVSQEDAYVLQWF